MEHVRDGSAHHRSVAVARRFLRHGAVTPLLGVLTLLFALSASGTFALTVHHERALARMTRPTRIQAIDQVRIALLQSQLHPAASWDVLKGASDRLEQVSAIGEPALHTVAAELRASLATISRSDVNTASWQFRLATFNNRLLALRGKPDSAFELRTSNAQHELSVLYAICVALMAALLVCTVGLIGMLLWQRHRAEDMALHDQLTGLPNRLLFRRRLDEVLSDPQSVDNGVSVLFLDMDDFKDVNDSLGHTAGDELLCVFSHRLQRAVPNGVVARLGGDEFAVMLPEGGRSAASALAANLRHVLSQPVQLPHGQAASSVSIGAATRRRGVTDAVDLLQQADLAMYEAKGSGRNSFHFFDAALSARLQFRLSMESDIRAALASDQFHLVFQPLILLDNKRISGCEALLRWQHPTRGLVPPMTFIPIAEQTGLVVEVGEWVLFRACAEAASWPSNVRVAVNLSPRQFRTDIVQTVRDALGRSGLPAHRLELEITETALMQDDDEIESKLKQLRGLGVHLALDDFGTGYSSLSYLQRFPFHKIKVDQSFVRSMPQRPESVAIVELISGLARRLGMTTVAEGIETAELLHMVEQTGCTEGQGYHFDRPLSSEVIMQRLDAQVSADRRSASVDAGE